MISHSEHTSTKPPQLVVYRTALLVLSLFSAGTILWLLALPRDPSVYPLLGIPNRRILMLGVSLLLTGLWSIPLALSYRKPARFWESIQSYRTWLTERSNLQLAFSSVMIVLWFSGMWLYVFHQNSFFALAPPPKPDFNRYIRLVNEAWTQIKPVLAILQPFLLQVFVASAIFAFLILFTHPGPARLHQLIVKKRGYAIAGTFLLIVLVWSMLGWTGIRLESNTSTFGWYTLGAPILETQVFLGLIAVISVFVGAYFIHAWFPRLIEKLSSILAEDRANLFIALILWVLAAYYWNTFPLLPNWFVSQPSYPNYAIYPNSDSIVYDTTAQSLLVGAGYQSGDLFFPKRPLYGLFLAGLYQISGPDFDRLTQVQAAIFGVFPALFYIVVSRFYNRAAGLIAAALILFREGNAIALANRITISTSRSVMSEMPTAILLLLASLLVIKFGQARNRSTVALWIGGIIAASMLVRIEAAIFLIAFLLVSLIVQWPKVRSWFFTSGMAILGVLLFLTPWLWRNWEKTGDVFIEQPGERLQFIADKTGLVEAEIDASSSDYLPTPAPTSVPTVEADKPKTAEISEPAVSRYFDRFGQNLINNYLQAILTFPDALRLVDSLAAFSIRQDWGTLGQACCARIDYYNRFPFWVWGLWDGAIPKQAALPILFTLLLLSVGLQKLYERAGVWGFFPLVLISSHYITISLLHISGGRFVQILDWVWIIYYSIGLATVVHFVTEFFGWGVSRFFDQSAWMGRVNKDPITNARSMSLSMIVSMMVILLLGSSIPLAEILIPPRYTPETQKAGLQELLSASEIQANFPELQSALQEQASRGILVLQGRALYPRFHLEFTGEPGTNPTPFTVKDFARFSFFVVGPRNTAVLLPIDYAPLTDFPHASDVLVIGCQDDIFVRASVVYNRSTGSVLLSSERDQLTACPSVP